MTEVFLMVADAFLSILRKTTTIFTIIPWQITCTSVWPGHRVRQFWYQS